MLKLISHRGNINGKHEKFENFPAYIDTTIEQGFDVEIDVRYHQHEFWLGHDYAKYEINLKEFVQIILSNGSIYKSTKMWEYEFKAYYWR